MSKANRRKKDRRRQSKRRVRAAGATRAPNGAGMAVDSVRRAVALVTAMHSTPDDLPALLDESIDDTASQALTAAALHSRFVAAGCEVIAEIHDMQPTEVLDDVVTELADDEANLPEPWHRVLATARVYAEVYSGQRPADDIAPVLTSNLGSGLTAVSYLIALTQLAHQVLVARCDETGEDVVAHLRDMALPAAMDHGNDIDADDADEYVLALIAERLDTHPGLLTRAAAAISQDPEALLGEFADEFEELGGTERLEQLDDKTVPDMDDDDLRLLFLVMLESAVISPDGATVAERIQVNWRF